MDGAGTAAQSIIYLMCVWEGGGGQVQRKEWKTRVGGLWTA